MRAYGLSEEGFVHVSEVKSGKSDCICPDCKGFLVAKKGKVNNHHFAHLHDDSINTCTEPIFDFYDIKREKFPVNLSLHEYADQKQKEIQSFLKQTERELQELLDLQRKLKEVPLSGVEFLESVSRQFEDGSRPRDNGKNYKVLCDLKAYLKDDSQKFPAFEDVRHSTIIHYKKYVQIKRFEKVVDTVIDFRTYYPGEIYEDLSMFVPEKMTACITSLNKLRKLKVAIKNKKEEQRIIVSELERFKGFMLYFLKIESNKKTIYKIGITGRSIKERLSEIKSDTQKLIGDCQIEVLYAIKEFAFLETFFKHKYKKFRHKFKGFSQTEYFDFSEILIDNIEKSFKRIEGMVGS